MPVPLQNISQRLVIFFWVNLEELAAHVNFMYIGHGISNF